MKRNYFIGYIVFTINFGTLISKIIHFGRQLGTTNKNMFLEFLPKNTVVDCSIKENRLWSNLSSTASESWSEKNETEEYIAWVITFEKELSIKSWEALKFLLRGKKSVGANTVESSNSSKVCITWILQIFMDFINL